MINIMYSIYYSKIFLSYKNLKLKQLSKYNTLRYITCGFFLYHYNLIYNYQFY